MVRGDPPASELHGVTLVPARPIVGAAAIGEVRAVIGSVTILRDNVAIAQVSDGDPVYQGDVIETGTDGSVAIAFVEGTTFRLSPGTAMVLDEFVCGPEKKSALFRILKGLFAVFAGKIATGGRLTIDTPLGQIRSTGAAAGIGSLAFGILTFSLIRELKAASSDVSLLDDGTIDFNDLKHGVFVIVTKDGKTIVVDDVTKTYWIHHGTSDELLNTPTQLAQLDRDFLSAHDIFLRGQEDPTI